MKTTWHHRFGLVLIALLTLSVSAQAATKSPAGAAKPVRTVAAKLQGLPAAALKQLPGLAISPLQKKVLSGAGVSKYHIVGMAPPGSIATLRLSHADGAMLMPDLVGQRLVHLSLRGAPMGIAYASRDAYSIVLRGSGGRAVGLMTLARNGNLTIALDPNRDGVADLVEVWQHSVRQTVFVRAGLGEEWLDAMMAGRNGFCLPLAGTKTDGGWLRSFDARAGLDMCSRRSDRSSGGSAGGVLARKGPADPLSLACAAFGKSLSRPARFAGANRAGDDDVDAGPISDSIDLLASLIPDAGTSVALAGIAKVLVDAYGGNAIVSALNSWGLPTVEQLAATGVEGTTGVTTAESAAATLSLAATAAVAFVAVTLTPSHTTASECETAPHGCAYDPTDGHLLTEAEHNERERREREAAAAAAAAGDDDSGTDTDAGAHSRPPEADVGSFRAFCARQQNQRLEWQRVMDDQRSRNFTECVDPLSGAPSSNHSLYCQFIQGAMNPAAVDIVAEAVNASRSSDSRGNANTPEGRIRDRLLEARRLAGDMQVVGCDPRICQPVP